MSVVNRRDEYEDNFALTKYTLPVIWQMANVIPGGFFIYKENENRELIYASQKVLEIYGCETLDEFKELTGFTFRGMVHPADFNRIQESIDDQIDSVDGDSNDYVVYRIVRKDGEVRWVDDYGHFSHSPEYGDVYYVFISDITETKKLEESNHEYHDEIDKIENYIEDISDNVNDPDKLKSTIDELKASIAELRSKIK
ncbi:MAG: PAS domain-containing protein [Lachnospiraceae bacterium]|nr:PAS domain-containing protein [Lachnospiraceae bacterium]